MNDPGSDGDRAVSAHGGHEVDTPETVYTFEYHGHVTILAFGAILPRNTASHKMGSHM